MEQQQQTHSTNDETFEDYYNEGSNHQTYIKIITNFHYSSCESFRS